MVVDLPAVGAQEARDDARLDGEGQIIDGESVAEALGDVVHGDHVLHDRRGRRPAPWAVRMDLRLV
jgi:hypothetical protein